jgi:hypothetical protein
MNEKIQYLKQCAGVDDNPDQEGLDLFAQLILEECISIAKFGLATAAVEVIKEHFGLDKTKE